MRIHVNGQDRELDAPATLADLIENLQFNPKYVAVEVNEQLVPRHRYASTPLQEGDRIEIVTLVGGG